MKNKLILSLGILFSLSVILSLSLVSAGLCRGSDGYYHDCNDFSERYYRNNFYPDYKTEYYKETSSSSSSAVSIKQDRWSYEEISASSSSQTDIESYKKERDYSHPKIKYDKYGREYYDSSHSEYYDYLDKWFSDEVKETSYDKHQKEYGDNKIIFLGGNYRYYEDGEDLDCSSWRCKEPYRAGDYEDAEYDKYYYEPRYDNYKGHYNWRW